MGSGGSTGKAEQHGGKAGVKALASQPTLVAVKPKGQTEQGGADQCEPEPEASSQSPRSDPISSHGAQKERSAPTSPFREDTASVRAASSASQEQRSAVDVGATSGGSSTGASASQAPGSKGNAQKSAADPLAAAGGYAVQDGVDAKVGGHAVRGVVNGSSAIPSAAHLQGYSTSSSSTAKSNPALRAGMAVRIVGLENAKHLNGKQGVLRNWDGDLGRWVVRLTNGEEKGIRTANVTAIQGQGASGASCDDADEANKGLEGLLLQTNWSAIYQLFHQRYGIAVLDKVERGHVVKSAVEMSLSIVSKCFALLRSDPSGRLHCTPLHIAALQSSTEAAEVIVRDLPKLVEQTHRPSHQALCPLHIAILCGSQPIVELLLEGRADANVRTLHDICPIHLAAMTSKDLCQVLLSYNAEPLRRDVMGSTAVHYAATFKQQVVVEALIQASPKLVCECDQKRVSPLHISCAMCTAEQDLVAPMMLLANGAKPWQTDVSGASARDVAPQPPNSALGSFFETNGDRVQAVAQQWLEQWRTAHEEQQDDKENEEEAHSEDDTERGGSLEHEAALEEPEGRVAHARNGSKLQSSVASTEEAMRLGREAASVEAERLRKEHAVEVERLKQELAQSAEERARLQQSVVSQRESVEAVQALSEETLARYKVQLEEAQRRQAEERSDWQARQGLLLASAREEGRADAQREAAQQLQEQQRSFETRQLQEVGCTLAQLKDGDFTARQLKHAGFSLKQLMIFDIKQLKDADFTARQLRDEGFTLKDLTDANFNAKQLNDAGFNARQLEEVGFTATQLKDGDFTARLQEREGQAMEARQGGAHRAKCLGGPEELELDACSRKDSLGVTLSGFGNKLEGFGSSLEHENAMVAKQQVMELSQEVRRLEQLHEEEQSIQKREIQSLQEQLQQARQESAGLRSRAELEAELEHLQADIAVKVSEAKLLQEQVQQLQQKSQQLHEEATGLRAQRAEAEDRCQQLMLDSQEADNRGKIREIAFEKRIADLEKKGAESLADAHSDFAAAKARAEAAEAQSAQMQSLIEKLKERNSFLESEFVEEQALRKKLHNQIQDMKGAIRVFCRFRPLVERERALGDKVSACKVDAFTAEAAGPAREHGAMKPFQFDSVFDSEASQDEVFADCKELVQSAVDGYNVTIFAYGQTGAGKTWTMYGNQQNPGLAPRSIQALFGVIQKEEGKGGKTFKVKAYMIELYKQDIIDLLADKPSNRGLEVKRDGGRGMMYVEGVTERDIATPAELQHTLAEGEKRRHVGATKMNSASSRSHLLLSIIIECTVKEPEQVVYGKITLCDLAGSERPKKSDVSGDALKEAIEINKSLSALGDVIEALTKGSKSVPYRNHKLTMLMQDSLGGSSKTLMFVNCSPAASNNEETMMSLKWAARARQITNEVKRNVDSKEVARLKQVIAMMSQAQNASDSFVEPGDQEAEQGNAAKQGPRQGLSMVC